jgi:hypothetical protein
MNGASKQRMSPKRKAENALFICREWILSVVEKNGDDPVTGLR